MPRYLVTVVAVAALIAAVPSVTDAECVRVKAGSGGATQTDAFGTPFTGGAALRLPGGETLVADVAVMLLGLPVPRPTHLRATTLHCFMAWEIGAAGPEAVGHFCTNDGARLVPSADGSEFQLNTRAAVVAGEWRGADVTGGRLRVVGTIRLGAPAAADAPPSATAEWTVKGEICVEE